MATKTKIDNIMSRELFTVDYYDNVSKAELIMRREDIRHIPVILNKKFIGMITEKTILEYTLMHVYDYDDFNVPPEEVLISDFHTVMIKDLPFIYPEDSIAKATELMLKKKIDVLPVIDWDKNLIGIVTSIDLLLFFFKKLKEEN